MLQRLRRARRGLRIRKLARLEAIPLLPIRTGGSESSAAILDWKLSTFVPKMGQNGTSHLGWASRKCLVFFLFLRRCAREGSWWFLSRLLLLCGGKRGGAGARGTSGLGHTCRVERRRIYSVHSLFVVFKPVFCILGPVYCSLDHGALLQQRKASQTGNTRVANTSGSS